MSHIYCCRSNCQCKKYYKKDIFCKVNIPVKSCDFYFCDNDEWLHDDVIKRKHFPRYWPFVRGIHRSPVNSPHKGQWRGALMFYLICVWINGWVNNREAGDLRRHRARYDVTEMIQFYIHTHVFVFLNHPTITYPAMCCEGIVLRTL